MKKITVLMGLLGFVACSGLNLKKSVASLQKERFIIDGKLIDPPYGAPQYRNQRVMINLLPVSPVIANKAIANRYIDSIKKEIAQKRLIILTKTDGTIKVIKDASVFDKVKQVLASKNSKAQKLSEINTLLKGYVSAKLILENN